MADALSKIAFAPFPRSSSSSPCHIHHLHHLSPPFSGLKSVDSSLHQRLSVKLPSTSRPFSNSHSYGRRTEFIEAWGFSRNSVSPARSSTISHVRTAFSNFNSNAPLNFHLILGFFFWGFLCNFCLYR